MKRRLGIVMCALGVAIVGCGGGSSNWSGTYSGPVSVAGSCSDGSPVSEPSKFTVDLMVNGNSFTWSAACGATATGSIEGNTATVDQFSCPASTSSGLTEAVTIQNGTLTLNGNSLSIDLVETDTLSGTSTGTCNVSVTGTLARETN